VRTNEEIIEIVATDYGNFRNYTDKEINEAMNFIKHEIKILIYDEIQNISPLENFTINILKNIINQIK